MYPNELKMCENPKAIGIFYDKLFEASGLDTRIVGQMSGNFFLLDINGC